MVTNYKQLSFLFGFFSFLIIFTSGCAKQSTFVNVNLPIDEVDLINNNNNNNQNPLPIPDDAIIDDTNDSNSNSNPVVEDIKDQPEEVVQVEVPSKLELDVDFAPQAPFSNWNELNEEACEEASMITVAKYFFNEPLNESIMEKEIINLDKWERERGYKIDLSANQVVEVLKNYYQINSRVVEEVTVDRIKYELSMGNLIIVPADGRELENPYFKYPGPIYHMLVIRGYNSNEFITNEVGTKRGDGFRYKYQKLIDAVHDWNPSWSHYEVTDGQMGSQPKRMVVVSGKI